MKKLLDRLKIFWNKISEYKYFVILRDAIDSFGNDRPHKLSASLAYTTIFSLAPMLVLVILIGSTLAEKSAIEGRVISELTGFVGENMARFIENLILQISFQKSSTTIATIVSSFILVIVATGLFVEIQDSLNIIWGVRPKKKKGFIKLILSRLISFLGIVIFGIFLALMIIFNTVFNAMSSRFLELLPWLPIETISLLNTLFFLVFMSIFFAMVFKLLPDVTIKWKDVWGGSIITTVLFLISKWLINIYISRNSTVSLYGAAGSVVVLMLWIYCSAFIFYFGAEFIRAVAVYRNRVIKPKQYAELAEKRMIEELKEKHKNMLHGDDTEESENLERSIK